MSGQSPFIDEEDKGLINEESTKKNYEDDKFCVRHWKAVFAGTGVIFLIALGVMMGAVFNKSDSDLALRGSRSTSFPYSNILLPGDVIPEQYRIFLHPNLTTFDYVGTVNILVKATNDKVSRILLHSKDLRISKVSLYEVNSNSKADVLGDPVTNGEEIDLQDFLKENKRLEMLMIRLKDGDTLDSKKKYVVHISFKGKISDSLDGFYRSSYKDAEGNTQYLATTHFEATAARKAFPCFDEPAMKAEFKIIIIKEPRHTALSNMPAKETLERRDGLEVVTFEKSVKMSTYLVAFVVCDYASKVAKTKTGKEVRVWAPKNMIEQAQFAIDVAPKVLTYYEEFFNVSFPLPKQDLIAIPDFQAGAMENWGLITYRLTSILYDEKESSSANKQWVAVVIAHELAHQWFGNLVTMKWWNDLWLNEGFAAFVEFIGADHADKSWQMLDQFIVDDVQSSLVLDSHINSHPISVKVTDPSQINEIFDTISYDKGASIIRMMKHFLGSDVFHSGLQAYLQKYQFKNAESDDLWTCLTKASKKAGGDIKVKTIMDTWTRQMGYPVINVTRVGNKAYAKQSHFIVDSNYKQKDLKHSPYNYKWEVPLTYYKKNKKQPILQWLHPNDANASFEWPASEGWLKMNVDQKGFYRVNYDPENWGALSKQLKNKHEVLSTSDRSNLMDDAFELAKANQMDQVKALEMTAYLKNEKEYVPWITALSSLGYIGGMLEGNDKYPSAYSYYERYMVHQVKPLVEELGWEDKGTHLNKYLRGAVLRTAVNHGDKKAIEEGKKMFNEWKNGQRKSIAPNLRSTVYLAAIKYGGEEEWNYMRKIFKETKFPSEERKIMFALADTQDKAILKKYLNEAMDKKVIRSQDTCSVIEHISGNPAGRKMAYDFVVKNWDKLFERYGSGSFDMSSLIKTVFGQYKNRKSLKEVEQFLKSHKDKLGSGKLASKQAIASIKNHIAWLKRNGGKVNDWFKNQVKSFSKRNIAM